MSSSTWLRSWITGGSNKKRSLRRRTSIKPRLDALEGRAVPAVIGVTLASGVLTITADGGVDNIGFQQWGGTPGQPATYNTRAGINGVSDPFDLLKSASWPGSGLPTNTNGIITGVTKVVIKGGGGNDTLTIYHGSSGGTVTELYGEGGDDILNGGHNTNDLLVGGAGNDTLNGLGGDDTIYGDTPVAVEPGGDSDIELSLGYGNSSNRFLAYNDVTNTNVNISASIPNSGTTRASADIKFEGVGGWGVINEDSGEALGIHSGVGSNKRVDGNEIFRISLLKDQVATTANLNFSRNDGTTNVQVTAYLNGTQVGQVTLSGVLGGSTYQPSFDAGVVFDRLDLQALTGKFAFRSASFDGVAVGAGNDILNGAGGNDTLYGQAGNDTLNWGTGTGSDVATGGLGNDIFIQDNNFAYLSLFGTITDFTQGKDKIRIKANEVGLNVNTWSLTTGTASQSNKIVQDTTTEPGHTIVRLPVGWTGKIKLKGFTSLLTPADFEVWASV